MKSSGFFGHFGDSQTDYHALPARADHILCNVRGNEKKHLEIRCDSLQPKEGPRKGEGEKDPKLLAVCGSAICDFSALSP